MDLFEEYLNKKGSSGWVNRALTADSFNKYRSRGIRKNNPKFKELHTPLPTNTDLAVIGDAVITVCYSDLLLDKVEQLTEEKKTLESDKVFVEKIAKHYDLLKYIDFDKLEPTIPQDYDYGETEGDNNPHKYIATAVEAIIGAMYKRNEKLDSIKELLDSWRNF